MGVSHLFSYDSWEQATNTAFNFYHCTLKHAIGKLQAGDVVRTISIDFLSGVIEFFGEDEWDKDEPFLKGKINVVMRNWLRPA